MSGADNSFWFVGQLEVLENNSYEVKRPFITFAQNLFLDTASIPLTSSRDGLSSPVTI